MRQKQYKLQRWFNPDKVFLNKEILNKLKEFNQDEKKISKKSIEKVIKKNLTDSKVMSIKEFNKGNINSMYEIKIKGSTKKLMLRVFNESWKCKKEEFVYRDIRTHVDVPIPEIHVVDDSKKILPHAYILMGKIEGYELGVAYKKYKNKKLFSQAGEILAKLHSIKFNQFGWIIDNEIKPAFDTWKDFVWHDFHLKLNRNKNIPEIKKLMPTIEKQLNHYSYLLDVKSQPCLIHKDYYCSHILANKNKITGIIDVEWAIAGHNENDFLKLELWDFCNAKNMRNQFFRGYFKNGHISSDYTERRKIYLLWHYINMINTSQEVNNKILLKRNIQNLVKHLK